MKPELTNRIGRRNQWRGVCGWLTFALFSCSTLTAVAAQSKLRRITYVWTTTSAEGSRVTVDADAPLSDYEAYKRGDRFYVRIPLSDLPSARGSLIGRGFDDVQIQRYGDGIMLSFHLQPGSAARVDQRGNRLEVIFSTPGRSSFGTLAATNYGDFADRTRPRRTQDNAGPTPPSSSNSRGGSHATGKERPSPDSRSNPSSGASARHKSSRDSASPTNASDRKNKKINPTSHPSKGESPNAAAPSATPSSATPPPISAATPTPTSASTSPSASPVAGGPISSASVTPTATPYNTPALASTPASNTKVQNSQGTDWASWKHHLKIWVTLNWLPILIGSLIVLCVLVLLVTRRGAKKRNGGTVTQVKQPKKDPVAQASPRPASSVATAPPVASADVAREHNQAKAAANSSSDEAAVGGHKDSSGDQEREVIEI